MEDETPAPGRLNDPRASGAEVQELREKIRMLEQELQDRDKQLEEQAAALNELQQSITELEGTDALAMRAQLREKNEKIAQLTAEFDAHRADFRSTLDTLEVAASETERVYEQRLDELMQQNRELQDGREDVETVARQLKQLEELVSELEEGLEDARRGEAEARAEVEFLRGEVERARLELKQEREKSAAALKEAENRRNTKELDQKDDEIRGLKAIIHSLSRGDVNPALMRQNGISPPAGKPESDPKDAERLAQLEQRIQELEGLVDSKTNRIEELQRELEQSRRSSLNGPGRVRSGTVTVAPLRQFKASRDRTSSSSNTISHAHTPSDRTVVPSDWQDAPTSSAEQHQPLSSYQESLPHRPANNGPDSDSRSDASTALWCEICETNGHDILTCTTFGSNGNGKTNVTSTTARDDNVETTAPGASRQSDPPQERNSNGLKQFGGSPTSQRTGREAVLEGLKGIGGLTSSMSPVAGKSSGVIDESKWCALCERDGHESIDCPFED